MAGPRFLTIQCSLLGETEKALHLHWNDEANEMDLRFWVPKKCIEADDDDRENTIRQLRGADDILVDVAVWWLQDQEWFDESIQELIDL